MAAAVMPKLRYKATGENRGQGYFAGTADGIVTVAGQPAAREIVAWDAVTLAHVFTARSLPDGHYLIPALDAERKYLIIARDYKGEYAPVGWDLRSPATDLDSVEQQNLWRSWN